MKKVLLGGVALITLGFVGAAVAADMPLKAPPPVVVNTWTGFYIGADIGGIEWCEMKSESFNQSPGLSPFGIVFDPVTYGSVGHWGATGGVHAGYNWQVTPSWLVGVEGDWDTTDLGLTLDRGELDERWRADPALPWCGPPAPAPFATAS